MSKLYLRVEEIKTDPNQYKPFSPTFVPSQPLLLALDVDTVEDLEDDGNVINVAGLRDLLSQVGVAVALSYRDYTTTLVATDRQDTF